jgi:glucose/arabinose dehydrogenase
MKSLATLTIVSLLVLLSACSGKKASNDNGSQSQAMSEQTQTTETPETTESAAKNMVDEAQEAAAKTEMASLPEGQEVTVSGTLGCGHCTYHLTDSCSAALQTADGGTYILDVGEDSPWFDKRYDSLNLKVTGTVHHEGTVVHLQSPNVTEI